MRAFIASFLKIDSLAYQKIKDFFNKDIISAKWVKSKDLHITYFFFKELTNPNIISKKIDFVSNFYPKELTPFKLNFFKTPHNIILFLSLKETQELKETFFILKDFLKKQDKQLISKPAHNFLPHITLARIKKIKNLNAFKDSINTFNNTHLNKCNLKPTPFNLYLIQSKLTPKGPIYTPYFTYIPL